MDQLDMCIVSVVINMAFLNITAPLLIYNISVPSTTMLVLAEEVLY